MKQMGSQSSKTDTGVRVALATGVVFILIASLLSAVGFVPVVTRPDTVSEAPEVLHATSANAAEEPQTNAPSIIETNIPTRIVIDDIFHHFEYFLLQRDVFSGGFDHEITFFYLLVV